MTGTTRARFFQQMRSTRNEHTKLKPHARLVPAGDRVDGALGPAAGNLPALANNAAQVALVPANGLRVAAAMLPFVQRLKDYAAARGWTFRLVSGYRSPAEQDRLRQLWEQGDPSVVFPPAQYSYHSLGLAIDLASNHLAELGAYAESIGMRWGGRFGDPVHFDLGRA